MTGIDETLRVYTQLPKCAIMFHISTRRLRSFTNWGPVMQKLLSARKLSQRLSTLHLAASGLDLSQRDFATWPVLLRTGSSDVSRCLIAATACSTCSARVEFPNRIHLFRQLPRTLGVWRRLSCYGNVSKEQERSQFLRCISETDVRSTPSSDGRRRWLSLVRLTTWNLSKCWCCPAPEIPPGRAKIRENHEEIVGIPHSLGLCLLVVVLSRFARENRLPEHHRRLLGEIFLPGHLNPRARVLR